MQRPSCSADSDRPLTATVLLEAPHRLAADVAGRRTLNHMAGGMSTGRETLAQRIANTKANAERQLAPPELERVDPDAAPPVRHCWYEGTHGVQAALLLEWRVTSGAWRGRIAVAAPDAGGWVLVEQWVEAAMLTPA